MKVEVTEKIIAKAGLSPDEQKVARQYYKLSSAGKKTKRWLENVPDGKRHTLLRSAKQKIQKALEDKRAEE